MRRLRVRKIARAEIVAAFEWYLERSPAAAQQFLNAVDDAMTLIAEAPERHPIVRGSSSSRSPAALPLRSLLQGLPVDDQRRRRDSRAPPPGDVVAARCALTSRCRLTSGLGTVR
ncbi:MAG: type II toxin-antitoxin system RelE/ParE family toxin [Gemmatimonadetes bacterium]|nr:type II toxin-antitoxin system RelE/ParE family toxin [Gemmatimonadota bacterium]